MQPKPSARGPPGQGPGSSVDAGASIRLGVHSHCTRVRYTHGEGTQPSYSCPIYTSKCDFDVYIGPVSDGRVPRCVYRACVRCPCTPQPSYMWVIYTSPPQVDMLSDWLSYKSGPRSHAHSGSLGSPRGVLGCFRGVFWGPSRARFSTLEKRSLDGSSRGCRGPRRGGRGCCRSPREVLGVLRELQDLIWSRLVEQV